VSAAHCQDLILKDSVTNYLGTKVPTKLREIYLRLYISLLNYKLYYKLIDSIVIRFLAALGINTKQNSLDNVVLYTPKLL
jgi:hypothetical protein